MTDTLNRNDGMNIRSDTGNRFTCRIGPASGLFRALVLPFLKRSLLGPIILLYFYIVPRILCKTLLKNILQQRVKNIKNIVKQADSNEAYNNCIYFWFFCFWLAYFTTFFLSGTSAPYLALDPSWQATLEYAAIHNFQFGRDIVFTFGPLGFLFTVFSKGLLLQPRLIFALTWSVFVAWSVIGLARQITGMMKFAFLLWFFVITIGASEQHVYFVIAYSCLILMGDVQKHKSAATLFLIALALLSITKFTFFMAVSISLVICMIVHVFKRNFKSAAFIAFIFGTVFLVLWFASGQQLISLGLWIKNSIEVTSGYTEAMTIMPKVTVLIVCLTAWGIYLFALLVIARTAQLNTRIVGILLTTTSLVFLTWKHGFVRADDHVFTFIIFMPIAFAFVLIETIQKSISLKARRALAIGYVGIIVLCVMAVHFQQPNTIQNRFRQWPIQLRKNVQTIFNLPTGDWKRSFAASNLYSQLTPNPDLSIARKIISKSSVDVFNYLQWSVLTNNLYYQPRPVFQSYSACTTYLQDLNLSFYRSENRPSYILLKMETIDERFPTLDDATVLPYILNNYLPVAQDGDFLVMSLSPGNPSDVRVKLLHEQTLRFGERLDLKPWNEKPLVMQVTMRPTLLGRVIKFFYQAPVLYLNTYTENQEKRYRFIPAMAEQGFIISPLLEKNEDIVDLLAQVQGPRCDSVYFSMPAHTLEEMNDDINIRLYRVDGFPDVIPEQATMRNLAKLRNPVFETAPVSVEAAHPPQILKLLGEPAMMVHAPSRVVLSVPTWAKEFSGFMGMLEGAYLKGGETDGVIYTIDAQGNDGKKHRLLTRIVQPKERKKDRGSLPFTVPVSSLSDKRLILTIGIGPNNDGNWDWSVWSKCRFK